MSVNPERVEALLNPTSVAIVGASERSAWSSAFVRNLTRWGFPGAIHLVNPRTPTVFDQITVPSVERIDGHVDHALIAVPAPLTMDVLADCARAGVRNVTAIASGFSEAGPKGKSLAEQVIRFCEDNNISMVGPNCYGFINFNRSTVLSRNSLESAPCPGRVSLVSQSGQVGAAIANSAFSRNVDLRYLVSSGNELVVSSTDFFDYFVNDPETSVVGGAIERIANPVLFEQVASRALEAGKPILICKLGRSAIGQKVAEAHTASVAGNSVVVETFLRDLGVMVVDTIDELVETAGILARRTPPTGAKTMFIGASGGAGGYFADLAEGSSIVVGSVSDALRSQLAEVTGLDASAIGNPLDMTASGAGALARVAQVVGNSGEFDVLVAQGEEPRSVEVNGAVYVDRAARNMEALAGVCAEPFLACFHSTGDREPSGFGKAMSREHDALYVHGQPGVKALGRVIDYGVGRPARIAASKFREAAREVSNASRSALLSRDRTDLLGELGRSPSEGDVKKLLAAYGLPTLIDRVCQTPHAAVEAAKELGFPVVMKISSPDVLHKTDAGGVLLDLRDEDAIREGFTRIMTDVASNVPDAQLDGVAVSQFISRSVEILLGVVVDPSLGPVVVVGAGGIYVEQFGDVTCALPPFDAQTAEAMLRKLRIWSLLAGVRGGERADIHSLTAAMVRFSDLVSDLAGSLVALEVNPLVVRPGSGGVVALDAVIELARPDKVQDLYDRERPALAGGLA